MRVAIVGTGYVGLVTAACLAKLGHHVSCLDINAERIAGLKLGKMPFHEPGLAELVTAQVAQGRLTFHTEMGEAVPGAKVVFVAVGTPPLSDGAADRTYVMAACDGIASAGDDGMVIVIKSTVPPGTNKLVRAALDAKLGSKKRVHMASNPEFLREGSALHDFLYPDRLVVGVDTEEARNALRDLYNHFRQSGHAYFEMDTTSAELSKYAANAMLATRISFMNEMAQLCDKVGANILDIRRVMGADVRIGKSFIYAGLGYGGSCFPKDVTALSRLASEHDCSSRIIDAVSRVNTHQRQLMATNILARFGKSAFGKRLAVWGLAFKPNTDDVRESPSISIIERLAEAGAKIRAYDPVARGTAGALLKRWDGVEIVDSAIAALDGADALLLATEWEEFRSYSPELLKEKMAQAVVFDGRNYLDRDAFLKAGFSYVGVGVNEVGV